MGGDMAGAVPSIDQGRDDDADDNGDGDGKVAIDSDFKTVIGTFQTL